MNEFSYKYKCTCNDKIHTLTYGVQPGDKIKKKEVIENIVCFDCGTTIKLIKIFQVLKNDKITNQEVLI